jgi:Ca2+-binding RTX toxin-like protein
MRIVPLVVAALLLLPSAASAVEAAPVNDDFTDAVDLNAIGEDEFVDGVNVAATKETNEPNHAGNAGGHSVWYTWTAPGDGSVPHVAIQVFGQFDTLLGVYIGPDVNTLTEVASNDDVGFGSSSVSFATTPGTAYRIAVDGFGGKTGRFSLFWNESPVNDNFAEAIVLAGASGSRTGDTTQGATIEPGEQDFFETGTSVWYSWTPPVDGTYKISTFGSGFDTVMAVYEGSSLEALEVLRFNDDDPDRGCCSSWIPLVDAQASTIYMIQVAALDFLPAPLALQWGPLILGTNGAETLTGTAGAEEIRGRAGNDVVRGGGGADLVFGGRGNDVVAGGAGNDFVLDRSGTDRLLGAGGADTLDARDRRAGDILTGGPGADVCRADPGDTRRTC